MAVYGYARVSSRDQNLNRQMDALTAFGVLPQDVFADKMSGRDFNRPAYCRMIGSMARGDTLVVKSIDRLGRSYDDILEQWRLITKSMGCSIVVLDMPLLDTRRAKDGVTGELIADIVLQLLSYVAHVERDNIRQRQAEGIAAAQARGVRFGRPAKVRPDHYEAAKERLLKGEVSKREMSSQMGVCISTLDKWLKEDAAKCAGTCGGESGAVGCSVGA